MKLSIIIVNFNGTKHTIACVGSLRAHAPRDPYQIIIVDNKSSDEEREELTRQLKDCTIVLSGKNLGFGGANNLGAAHAKGEFLFFLNNDTIVTSDVFTPLMTAMDRNPRLGIIGPALRHADGTFQVSFGRFPSVLNEGKTRRFGRKFNRAIPENVGVIGERERDWVTGAAMLMRKECFDRLKGFDESYFMYFEDVDLCYRACRLGYGIGYLPECPIIHLGGMSYASGESHIEREYRKSQLRYYDKFQTLPQRIMIRVYLLLKASVMLISGSDARTSADNIGQIFKSHGN